MGGFDDLLRKAGMDLPDLPPEPKAKGKSKGKGTPQEVVFGTKLVLRYTKKGRGGKPVTLVQGIASGQATLCKTLKKKLGCGAKVEGDDIAVQGDQRERLKPLLEKMGAKQVKIS